MSNLDIVKLICHELGKLKKLITFVEDRKGYNLCYAVNTMTIEHELD